MSNPSSYVHLVSQYMLTLLIGGRKLTSYHSILSQRFYIARFLCDLWLVRVMDLTTPIVYCLPERRGCSVTVAPGSCNQRDCALLIPSRRE